MVTFKRLALTDFKIDIPRLAKKKVLTAALEDSGADLLHVLPPCTAVEPWLEFVLHIASSPKMSSSATAQPMSSCA